MNLVKNDLTEFGLRVKSGTKYALVQYLEYAMGSGRSRTAYTVTPFFPSS